jgi:hypothetical protein
MFFKKTEDARVLPPITYELGEPELSGGKCFWAVYRVEPYWDTIPLIASRPIKLINARRTKIKYFENPEEATVYIRSINEK